MGCDYLSLELAFAVGLGNNPDFNFIFVMCNWAVLMLLAELIVCFYPVPLEPALQQVWETIWAMFLFCDAELVCVDTPIRTHSLILCEVGRKCP